MRLIGFTGLAALLLASAPAFAAPAPPPDLESYLSYPFLGELVAPQQGSAIAWIENRKGVRNIWLARAPDFKPVKLTDGIRDDGMEIASLAFSPDGRVLAWSRGGGEHNSWASGLPAPDPESLPSQPSEDIWASVDGGAPIKLAEGAFPAVSPSGRIGFVKKGEAWTVDAKPGAKAERLFFDRGKITFLDWSPDGSKLAFVSHRKDHSFVGVYSGPDTPITWLSPSTGIDYDPAWSPDGKRIAFTRRMGIADILATSLEEKPNPFAIWVADAATGEGHAVWSSPATLDGSYPEVPGGMALRWGAGDMISFRAEMDGWPHLYALAASGGEPRLLTPGKFMVEHVAMTPDRSALVFDANTGGAPGDIDRRHLYRVSIAGGAPTALSGGTGIEFEAAPAGGGKLAWIASTPTTAMKVVLSSDGKSRTLDTGGAAYAPTAMVVPKPVSFTAADGTLVHGQLFEAKGGKTSRPGLIFVHGGPPRQMLLGWSYMDYYSHSYAMNQYYATHGYTVLSVNYRLGIGYGRAFQHPEHAGFAGNSEYQDVLAGVKYLMDVKGVDPKRIGIWGGSYGGLLTAHALAHNSDIFKAGVDFHGVHDWTLIPHLFDKPTRYEQGDYQLALKTAFESSPEAAIKGWTSPVLLIAGDDDRNVNFEQTVDLARRLAAQGTPFEELVLPDEIHGFLRYESWFRADTAAVDFLKRKLGP